jgi:ribosomal protein L37AE/L43A
MKLPLSRRLKTPQSSNTMIPRLPCPKCNHPTTYAKQRRTGMLRYTCRQCGHVFSPPRPPIDIAAALQEASSFVPSQQRLGVKVLSDILRPWGYFLENKYNRDSSARAAYDILTGTSDLEIELLQSSFLSPAWIVDGPRMRIVVLGTGGKVAEVIEFADRQRPRIRPKTAPSLRIQSTVIPEEIPCGRASHVGGVALLMRTAGYYQCFCCKWQGGALSPDLREQLRQADRQESLSAKAKNFI